MLVHIGKMDSRFAEKNTELSKQLMAEKDPKKIEELHKDQEKLWDMVDKLAVALEARERGVKTRLRRSFLNGMVHMAPWSNW